MTKRLLTIGYNISQIHGFDNISFSNYSLKFSSEGRWQKKLSTIENKIINNEIQSIIIVVCKNLINEIETLSNKQMIDFLRICKKTNCIIAIQEYLLEDEPLYYDYLENRKLSIDELQGIVIKLEKEQQEAVMEFNEQNTNTGNESTDEDILDDELFRNSPYYNEKHAVGHYTTKLELLQETKNLFPKAKNLIEILKNEFEEFVTFKFLNQVIEIAKDELIEQFANEILNIYIPKQYGYKFEFDDFIQVFEKYLKNIEQLNISVEINETTAGINYKFISNDKIESITDLPNKFNRFTRFIDLCEKEPETALQILETKNIAPKQALEIIQRLSKKYKRLVLDIQQQQERLELTYKQEIQSELFEFGYTDTPLSLVEKSFSIKAIDHVFHPNEIELQFIDLIQKHEEILDSDNIKSELGILNDLEIKPDDRKRSAYKLKKRLSKILNKGIEYGEKIIIESIITYINSKIN